MKAHLTNARISPKKANLIAGMVSEMNVLEALDQLKFTPKKGAKLIYKVLLSAVANAKNNFQQDEEKLDIKSILVTKGVTYKRGNAVSRGRYHPILKRNCNISIEIGLSVPKTAEVKSPEATAEEKTGAVTPKKKKIVKKSPPQS